VEEGHINRAVKQAIAHGIPPLTAIQMATINTAEHFHVTQDIGLIAPGRYADILLMRDLSQLDLETVIAKGKIAAANGVLQLNLPAYHYPAWAVNSVHLKRELTGADFQLPISRDGKFIANVIGVIENQAPTRHLQMEVFSQAGEIKADGLRDIAKIALVERHRGMGGVTLGLVNGFGFDKPCAIGSTVAHDSHQMIVVGTDENDMAKAANELAKVGGGQIVIHQGEIIGLVELPIAGLMSNEHADAVARKAASVLEGFKACGCNLNNPNMQLSLLALVVIPELRISDLGLVDVIHQKIIPTLQ